MRTLRWLTASILLATLAVVAMVGCGQLPSAPAHSVGPSGVGKGLYSQSGWGITQSAAPEPIAVSDSIELDGAIGGVVSTGRWSVELAPGAVTGLATVTIGVPDDNSPDCELKISPDEKNLFTAPVVLTVDCRGVVDPHQLRSFVIFWFDPDKSEWVPVPGSIVDFNTMTVSAPLQHFSQYGVGPSGSRAGW